MKLRLIAAVLLVATLAACGKKPLASTSNLTVTQIDTLPAPTTADLSAEERPYLIGPFDKLTIDVFGIEELSDKEIQADASGRISMPLAGVLEAAGRTPGQLAEAIEERLRARYIRDPQVTVNLMDTVSQVITVDGQVNKPGLYPVLGRMTLLRAIATAEGTAEFADLEDVIIFRTVDDQRYAALYNLKAIRRGIYDDPEVFANDIVTVGDSPGRRLFANILQIAPLLTTPLVVALQNNR